ncbi:carboxypeptidase-like regulatory domain-containing protein [Adhaeribacter swui]|uniref:Carboxypeptidase-like regulatory domain-containing protein n=1 Tax=Adhaeribacter swui TaxID=2086471 RepID=A0A7G7G7D2_9BACT|nr:TonB-dependent receptor [Adhaeribacter swui]QNF33066.1 carboxypeptidase-like regulatory domain-containing protein [Adhaeribacter swui]
MVSCLRLILTFILVSGCFFGYAQNIKSNLITGNFKNLKFPDFVAAVETQTTYHFYYEPATVDSLLVTIQVNEKPLATILPLIFKGTTLHFAIDAENRVYITSNITLDLNLPADYFKPEDLKTAVTKTSPVNYSTEPQPGNSRSLNLAERKIYEIGRAGKSTTGQATLAGHLRDVKSGEPVIGAAVYIQSPSIGVTTDQFGYYALTLPTGRHDILIRGSGIKNTKRQVLLQGDGQLEIEVEEDITPLKEVVIEAEKDKNVAGMQMGLEKLDIKTMRQVPTAFGETDILRVVLTLPGVKSVGEGNTGMNVRGGATDQNLILFNDATIYNPAHLFGFFSAFNPDILKTVELYKSAIPAKYGGRLSSVLEIATRDGNKKEFSGSGGIGLLTSRLTLEGPIIKDKTAFIIGGRSTYSDWLLQKLPNSTFKQSSAGFYDVNAHISHEINSKNSIYATGYMSRDKFRLAADTLYKYVNQNASLKWKHIFNNKLYGVLTGAYSHYNYNITSNINPVNASELTYSINQSNIQADFNYFHNAKHTFDFGFSSILYNISPGSLKPLGVESLITTDLLEREKGLESAVYVSDRIDLTPRFSVMLGLRYSLYHALGPKQVYQYLPNQPKSESTITDTVSYNAGDVLAKYHGPEYRLSAKYALTDNSSVKVSYNRMRQYIHMLSNTAAMSPTDIWKLSDAHIRPQIGDQVALGYYRNFKSNTIETSIETYYKKMHDFVDYKSGATLLLNHHIETDVINAEGKAYGVEVMVKKLTGKINGWVSYTYSRSLVKVNTGTTTDMINKGNYYPSNFDKPHDFTLIGNYRFSRRFSTSLNFTYNTGRPITLPLAKYYVGNSTRVYYSDRNAYRVPDYYRADFAMNIEGNHKVKKLAHSSWTLAIYNLTGRKNPYSIYFKSEGTKINGYQLSVFGRPIPTITYNFKF